MLIISKYIDYKYIVYKYVERNKKNVLKERLKIK